MSGTGRRSRVNPLVAGFAAGVAIALVVGLMATINLQYGAPWAKTHALTAQVVDADSMSVGSDVRIAGRLVGQVTSITAAGSYANVKFHIDDSSWPLPADTTAAVRLATLLGQKYIQLNPGHNTTQLLADNGTIGLQATKPVVDFDQILNTFDDPTRSSLTSLIRTASAAVQGQEGTLQQLFPDLSLLSVHSQVPTQELVTRDPQLNQILINLGITADQLNQSRDDFAAVIDHLNTVTAALASNQGTALKSYITNTDSLNLTTHAILGNGFAATLDKGLQQLGSTSGHVGFTTYLDQLLIALIPQTNSMNRVPYGTQPSEHGKLPSQAAIDLIYEIGDATSQGDAPANFFLRQAVQSVDICGLLPCTGLPVGIPAPPSGPPPVPTPCIPLLTCPLPSLPIPTPSLPIPLPTLPIPTPTLPIPTPTLPIPTPTLPIPTPTLPVCIPIPLITCPPAPAPTFAANYSDALLTDAFHWLGFWPLRLR